MADTIANTGMAMLLEAKLVIDDGTTIGVDISPDGANRAQIQGSGTLNFNMNPFSDMRLSGRYTIEKGFVRYTPPLMTEKLFDFRSGSYVALNIHADDVVKANVTEEGQNSRLVNFIVSLGVTGTLEDMDVAFDLSTDDDITISNELQSMSQSQRANQAMNMLLYNVYTRHKSQLQPRRQPPVLVPDGKAQHMGGQHHTRSRHIVRHRPVRPHSRRSHIDHHKL